MATHSMEQDGFNYLKVKLFIARVVDIANTNYKIILLF